MNISCAGFDLQQTGYGRPAIHGAGRGLDENATKVKILGKLGMAGGLLDRKVSIGARGQVDGDAGGIKMEREM